VGAGCKGCKETKFAEFEDQIVPDNWFFPNEKTYFTSFITDSADVVYYLLGDLYEKRGDTVAALQAFTSSIIAKKYSEGMIYYRRGKVLLKTGEFEPAVRDFSWTISGFPMFADAYLERGVAILMLGHDDLAQKDFDIYLALNPAGKEILTARIDAAKKLREEMKKPGAIK
jgi:tetratricopeptide (TPR) repeat protein